MIKPGGNLLYCKKIQGGHRGERPRYRPWDFYQNSPRPEQSLGQEERKAAEIFLPLHTSPLDFPQPAPTWQTLHHEGLKEITREMPVSIELASKSSQCSFQQTSKSKETEKKRTSWQLISESITVRTSKHQQELSRIYNFMQDYFHTEQRTCLGNSSPVTFCDQNTQALIRSCQDFIFTLPKLLN